MIIPIIISNDQSRPINLLLDLRRSLLSFNEWYKYQTCIRITWDTTFICDCFNQHSVITTFISWFQSSQCHSLHISWLLQSTQCYSLLYFVISIRDVHHCTIFVRIICLVCVSIRTEVFKQSVQTSNIIRDSIFSLHRHRIIIHI